MYCCPVVIRIIIIYPFSFMHASPSILFNLLKLFIYAPPISTFIHFMEKLTFISPKFHLLKQFYYQNVEVFKDVFVGIFLGFFIIIFRFYSFLLLILASVVLL